MTDKKTVPNPNGKKGGKKHQLKIEEIEKDILNRDYIAARERAHKKEGTNKKRYSDIVAIDSETKDIKEIHQIGKQNKNGTPVKRERKAIEDIEKATGLKVIFHPYNIFIFIVLMLISAAKYIF